MTIACVLRSGGTYTPKWVEKLYAGLRTHLPANGWAFRCLSDVDVMGQEPFRHGWPGWWAKLALFRPGVFEGPVLYVDLDSLAVGDLTDLASYEGTFAILADFYRPRHYQSAVMAWTPGPVTEALYARFVKHPEKHMRRYRSDQEFIEAALRADGVVPDILQELHPRQLVSLKVHARKGPPPGARLVCFHGRPRPNHPAAGWAHAAWKAQGREAA